MRREYFYVQAWKPALVAAGLTADAFVFHGLRHFCASSMLAEGVPITAVAGHLGDTLETSRASTATGSATTATSRRRAGADPARKFRGLLADCRSSDG